MATKPRPRPTDVEVLEEQKPQNDWEALLQHIKHNPVMWAASVAFILVCALAGTMYRLHRASVEKDLTAEYVRALKLEEPAERVAALAPLTERDSAITAEVLYMRGETAIEAGDYDTAKESFERLRNEYPDFEFTPDAVEGIGFVEEEAGNYDAAIERYRDVAKSWPESFTARRQPFNIAQIEERRENWEAAIAAYREQLEVFPGSNVSRRAQEALDRLRDRFPQLFPEDDVIEPGQELELGIGETAIPQETEPLPIDETEAPVDETPSETLLPDTEQEVAPTEESAPEESTAETAPPEPAEGEPTPTP